MNTPPIKRRLKNSVIPQPSQIITKMQRMTTEKALFTKNTSIIGTQLRNSRRIVRSFLSIYFPFFGSLSTSKQQQKMTRKTMGKVFNNAIAI
jgi:hypothetical protein